MILLAFETSCDETSVAVIRHGEVVANVVSSQVRLHADYGGVVPELAAREHLRHLPQLARLVLREARVEPRELEAVAATRGPGLPNALMVGLKAAQGLAFALERPCLCVHHHEAHLYSPWVAGPPLRAAFDALEPHLALIVSGGHTMLVAVHGLGRHEVIGSTLDDAAGECFDKTAKLLGLPYPGGPVIDRLAAEGNPRSHQFPRPLLGGHEPEDFSFSGLKTAVRYELRDHPQAVENLATVKDLCASIQAAIVEVLVTKTLRAARRRGLRVITASGGVSCNRALRRELAEGCRNHGLALRLAPPELCTDNAAMVGLLAEALANAGQLGGEADADIRPNWPLAEKNTPGAAR